MKGLQFLLFLFCFSSVAAQKQYSLELHFLTDKNEIAPNVKVAFIKSIDSKEGAVIAGEATSDNKGVLKLKLPETYFDKEDLLIMQAFYDEQNTYYFDYYEEVSKKQFPFKKTVKFQHIVPPTLEEINNSNVPPPPMPPKASKNN